MKKLIFGVFLAVCWCTGTVKAQDIAVKTNLLYWSSTTPNLSLEFGLGKRTTLDLTGAYDFSPACTYHRLFQLYKSDSLTYHAAT